MKKITFITCLLFTTLSYGQEYYHSLGGQYGVLAHSYYFEDNSSSFGNGNYDDYYTVTGIVYKGSLAFESGNLGYFAISAYPLLGYSSNLRDGASFSFEIPVMAEYYFGEMDDDNFFAGLGWTYASLNNNAIGGLITGPQLGIGGQIYIFDRYVSVRVAYTHGVNKTVNILENESYSSESRRMISLGFFYSLDQ